jgi:hypothetical protein
LKERLIQLKLRVFPDAPQLSHFLCVNGKGRWKESEMPDERMRHGAQDRGRINLGEEYEVEYWTKTLGVSRARLAEIINKVGDGVEAVRREVGRAA